MKDKGKLVLGVLITMVMTALILRTIDFYTKNGAVEIKHRVFKVEVVKNYWELEKGLSGRKTLGINKGMFFIFDSAKTQEFWMKDMKFSIDIIWINDGKIVDIKGRAPIPATHYLERYRPELPAKYVLEINAGLSEKYGFKVGDDVKLDI